MSNLVIEVRDSTAEIVIKSSVDLSTMSESEKEELKHFPCSPHVPVYLDYLQSSHFNSEAWTIVGPTGYTQVSPQKTTTSFVFKFELPGKYVATLTASYTAPSNQSQASNWTEQKVFKFIVKEKAPFYNQLPDLDFISELLPSVYSLVDNLNFVKSIWSGAGSLVAQEILSSVEIDQSKAIQSFPDYYQKKWIEFHPQILLEDLDFKSFFLVKPMKDTNIVVFSESAAISPSDFSIFSQITLKNTLDFTVKDYNSLNIVDPTPNLNQRVFSVSEGPETGFTFRVESVEKSSVTISPKLPATLLVDDPVKSEAASQLGSSGLIVVLTNNSSGAEYLRTLSSVSRSSEKLILNETVPAGVYTVEIHSVVKSFSSFEDLGVSEGDRLVVDINRGEASTASIPVEIYKVLGNSAAIRVETSSGLSFSDPAIFVMLNNLNYSGAFIDEDFTLSFVELEEVLSDGEIVPVLSEAETFYEMLKYPKEALSFDIFKETSIRVGEVFRGTIQPRYILRGSKIPKPEHLRSVTELRNFIQPQNEFIEDGFVKSVDSEGSVFIKANKSVTLLEGVDFTIDPSSDFITLQGFSYENPPPKNLWSPLSLINNIDQLEKNFAKAANLTYAEYVSLTSTLMYRKILEGLMYSYCQGPTIESIEIGLHLLLDIPIVTEESIILVIGEPVGEEIYYQVSTRRSQETRSIFLPRRDYVNPIFNAKGINRFTKDLIEVGDIVPAFTPLSQFIKLEDNIGNSVLPTEIHTWKALVDASVVDTALIPKTKKYLDSIKPAYTKFDFIFILFLVDFVYITVEAVSQHLHYIFLDTIGPYQSERSMDSWAHGAILRRFDSASYSLRTYSYGRGLQVTQTNLVDPNANPDYHNPFLASDTEIVRPTFGSSPIETGGMDSVVAGDFLVLTTGINQGVYTIDIVNSNGTWTVSPATNEKDSDAVADLDFVEFYVVRLDNNASTDSDDDWEDLSPLDVPSIDMNFGNNTVSGTAGTLTHSSLASGQTFEMLNVRPDDIIIIDSVEHTILSVSSSSITIQNQDTFTNKQFVIRRFL